MKSIRLLFLLECKAWEHRKTSELADFYKGSGYSKTDLLESGEPIILYGSLYTNYHFSISEVDTFVNLKSGSIVSQGNEVIIPASGETAEEIARAAAVEIPGVILGGDLNILKPITSISSQFFALTLSNGKTQKELAKKAQGKSVVHIRNSDIKSIYIDFPTMIEQVKIVEVFMNLENLLSLHQREPCK